MVNSFSQNLSVSECYYLLTMELRTETPKSFQSFLREPSPSHPYQESPEEHYLGAASLKAELYHAGI